MKRKVHITRKDAGFSKYSSKPVNVWFDSGSPNPPNYKVADGKKITIMSVDEKEHRLVLQRPGLLGGDVVFYTVPKGSDDLELTVSVDKYNGKLTIRKKPGKKSSSGTTKSSGKTSGSKAGTKTDAGAKTGAGTKSGGSSAGKTPSKTTRNLYIIRGASPGQYPDIPVRMGLDYNTPQYPVHVFLTDGIYTISIDKKEHDLVFFYPDVQTGDLVLRSVDAGSEDAAFYVDFDSNGVLCAVKTEVPKKPAAAETDKTADIAASPTTTGVKEYIADYIDLSKGAPVPVLLHALNTFEHLRVSVGSDAVSFFACHKEMDDQKIASCSYTFANQKFAGAAGTFTSLNTLSQRNQLLAVIRDFVNNECPGVSMKGTKIYKDAGFVGMPAGGAASGSAGSGSKSGMKTGQKTTTPDMNESLTAIEVTADVMRTFDEKSEFAADLDKVAKTCLLSVEEDRVRVTIMVEDFETAQALPDAGTQVKEFVYSEVDTSAYFELNYQVSQKNLDNQFDFLVREEDRQILMEKILSNLRNMSHLIVEGNTFRSRRKGEELIDVEHTLTAAAMKHKIMKLFTPDSKLVDVLRYSNVNYCQISADEEDISFAYLDMEGEICEIIRYTFEELVGLELLEGEDCFGQLRYGHEREVLEAVIGQGLCTLPYLKSYYEMAFNSYSASDIQQSLGMTFYSAVCLNPDAISKVSDVYETPAWIKGDPETPETPEIPGIHETPDEPEIPAKSALADSPTTASIQAQLAQYFGENGAFRIMLMTTTGMTAKLYANTDNVSIGFLRTEADGSVSPNGTFEMKYAHFGDESEGCFVQLDESQQKELEEILWEAFPFLRD